jgi:hypothetical protein
MPIWGWIIVAAVVLALVAVAWVMQRKRRTGALKQQFGPEYDRAVKESGTLREGESELAARRERRERLDIRDLSPQSRDRYGGAWRAAQERFVDSPSEAVGEADSLVIAVMRERGYPIDDFDQRSADISVDHPDLVENYRAAHGISMANDHQRASTEDLRQAMVHYRLLFEELLGGEDPRHAQQA